VAGLAEHEFGAARGFDDFVYLTVSTGVGGSVVSGGRLLQGPDGTAGELGHMPIDIDGPACGCGSFGHVEAICSGTAIGRAACEAVDSGRSPFLAVRAATNDAVNARDVSDGEVAGDAMCIEIMDRVRQAFAAACVGYVNVFNPSRIVVGGSVAEHLDDRLLDHARHEVEQFAFRAPGRRVRIVAAELGPDVSLAGGQPLVTSRLADPAWRAGRPMPVPPSGW
jgi:glucokinase